MFKRPEAAIGRPVRLSFEGQEIRAAPGDSIAVALLAAGVDFFRHTPRSGAPRGPWCMMGACFDCLVVVDDVPNRQACQITVADGMKVARQRGAAEVGP
ncbi:MAG: (2Fe-2S)-binding protein [Pseudomonadota bacterium]